MPYSCEKNIPQNINNQLQSLYRVFHGNEWATNYINTHKFRCYDDYINIQKIAQGGKVLNVGGAPYIFETFFMEGDQSITSLDLDPDRHLLQIQKMNFNILKCDIECADSRKTLALSGYDVICLCEVFEHMRIDLISLVRFLYNNMDQGSYLYMTTPNYFFARTFIRRILSGRSGPSLVKEWSKLTDIGHMGHVREYSQKDLTELFLFVGFKLHDIRLRNRSVKITK